MTYQEKQIKYVTDYLMTALEGVPNEPLSLREAIEIVVRVLFKMGFAKAIK